MRRNFPRMNKPSAQNGPLMTNHIELQDLDLELELLKRKRQMIEKQQQQLSNKRPFNNHQRQYNYNEPPQMFQGQQQLYNPSQNFSNNFGQSSAQPLIGNQFSASLLGKRPNESKWNATSTPKRFAGPQGGSKKKFVPPSNRRSDPMDRPAPFGKHQQGPPRNQNFQPNPQSQPHQPWTQLPFYMGTSSVPPSQRFNSSKSKPINRDFKPSKVTKPKATTTYFADKLVSYPIPNRKGFPKEVPKLANQVDEPLDNFILHADKVPTQQVAGRLELALGNILKDIKNIFGNDEQYKASFLSHIFMREVKQAIRERLRIVMIGKHVGKVGTIVEEYRNVFPLESDSEIVTVALKAQKAANNKQIPIKLEDTDSPESYFKSNMDQLISKSLDEMFNKLHSMYGADHSREVRTAVQEILAESKKDVRKDVDFQDNEQNTGDAVSEQNDATSEPKDTSEQKESISEQSDAVSEKNVDATSEKNDAVSEKNVDATSEKNVDATSEKNDATSEKNDATSEKNDATSEKNDATSEANDATSEQNVAPSENVTTEEKVENDEGDKKEKDNKDPNTSNASDEDGKVDGKPQLLFDYQVKQRIKKMEYVIGSIIKRRLAFIFPKYKTLLCKILNDNSQYVEARDAIVAKLQDKLSIETRMEAARVRNASAIQDTSVASEKQTPAASTPAAAPKILPYYVKILGRPGLPKRKQMQTFLKQYNPKSIKKHRNMALLFVGFNNKEDFNKMLEVKEVSIGNCTISIKVSEKTLNESQNETFNVDDDVQVVGEEASSSISDIINPDLDDQISNLLSSIRQEEERTQDELNAGEVDKVEQDKAATDDAKSDDVVILESTETENGQSEMEVAACGENTVNVPADDENKEVATDGDAIKIDPSENTEGEAADQLEALKSEEKTSGRATPTRASARLATPSSIRTRRASRLAQN